VTDHFMSTVVPEYTKK